MFDDKASITVAKEVVEVDSMKPVADPRFSPDEAKLVFVPLTRSCADIRAEYCAVKSDIETMEYTTIPELEHSVDTAYGLMMMAMQAAMLHMGNQYYWNMYLDAAQIYNEDMALLEQAQNSLEELQMDLNFLLYEYQQVPCGQNIYCP